MDVHIDLKTLLERIDWQIILIFGLIAAISLLIYLPPSGSRGVVNINHVNTSQEAILSKANEKESEVPSNSGYTDNNISSYLVLDVEATCVQGKGYDWPNEIIEWPIILLRWKEDNGSKRLVVVDEFHSFVRPTYKPSLDPFCTQLTGITQDQVDQAPTFPEVLASCKRFLMKNGIINSHGKPLEKFAWATDGPWDLRDFLTKQLFISKIERPAWIPNQVLDVREAFGAWYTQDYLTKYSKKPRRHGAFSINPSYRLAKQLEILGMTFEGREHSGIDDARNIARVVMALAERGLPLRPNLDISATRHFEWMGSRGTIIGSH